MPYDLVDEFSIDYVQQRSENFTQLVIRDGIRSTDKSR